MTYDFYPFTSQNVVWADGNKVFLDEDDTYVAFVCIEKDMINEVLRSEQEAQKLVIGKHLCKVEFIYPKLLNMDLMPVLKKARVQRLKNARELSKGDPNIYAQEREKVEKSYLKDLDDAGYTHLTYGIVYPGYPDQELIIDAIKQLEKQILEF